MSVIRAISNTSGNARDVACDEAGRLIIAGVTVDLSGAGLTVDLTSTNALLNQIVASLDPVSGNFEVTIANTVTLKDTPPIKVDLQALNPALLFPVRVNSFAPGSTLDVNVKTLDPTLNLKVTIADITSTAPLRVVVDSFSPTAVVKVDLANISTAGLLNVNVSALNSGLFPNGFPIDIRHFSAGTPIPFTLSSINTTLFPNGIPVNLATSGALAVTIDTSTTPLKVTIDTSTIPLNVNVNVPAGGLPVSWNTSQLTNLLNTINNASVTLDPGTEVIIRDADGVLSDTNPLRTRGALIDGAGVLISASNRLPVSAQLLGANGLPISPTNGLLVSVDPLTPLDAKVQVLTKNQNTVVVADNVLQPLQVLNTGDLVSARRLYEGPNLTVNGLWSSVTPPNYRVTFDHIFDPGSTYNYIVGFASADINCFDMTGSIFIYSSFTALPASSVGNEAVGLAISFNPFASGNHIAWTVPSQSAGLESDQVGFIFSRQLYALLPSNRLVVNAAGARRMRVLIWSSANPQGNLSADLRIFYTKV